MTSKVDAVEHVALLVPQNTLIHGCYFVIYTLVTRTPTCKQLNNVTRKQQQQQQQQQVTVK